MTMSCRNLPCVRCLLTLLCVSTPVHGSGSHWLEYIFSGHFGENYVESIRKVGMAHVRVGLEPSWYICGYSYCHAQTVQSYY